MSMKSVLTGIGIWIAVFGAMLVLMVVITFVGTFYLPTLVPTWKAQGLTEMPYGLQVVVDVSDFCIHRWFVALPILVVGSVVISKLIASRVGGERSA